MDTQRPSSRDAIIAALVKTAMVEAVDLLPTGIFNGNEQIPKVYHAIISSPQSTSNRSASGTLNLKGRQSSPGIWRQATAVGGKGGVAPQVDRGPVIVLCARLILLYPRDRRDILAARFHGKSPDVRPRCATWCRLSPWALQHPGKADEPLHGLKLYFCCYRVQLGGIMTRPSTGFLCRHHLERRLVSTAMLQRSGDWGLVYEIGKTRPVLRFPPSWPGPLYFQVSRHLQTTPPQSPSVPGGRGELLTQCRHRTPALTCGDLLL